MIMRVEDPKTRQYYLMASAVENCSSRVLGESEQLFASKYRTILPTEEELLAELERPLNLT